MIPNSSLKDGGVVRPQGPVLVEESGYGGSSGGYGGSSGGYGGAPSYGGQWVAPQAPSQWSGDGSDWNGLHSYLKHAHAAEWSKTEEEKDAMAKWRSKWVVELKPEKDCEGWSLFPEKDDEAWNCEKWEIDTGKDKNSKCHTFRSLVRRETRLLFFAAQPPPVY